MKAKHPAVVFIEFQNDFREEKGALYAVVADEPGCQSTVSNAARLPFQSPRKLYLLLLCPFVYEKKPGRGERGVGGRIAAAAEGL